MFRPADDGPKRLGAPGPQERGGSIIEPRRPVGSSLIRSLIALIVVPALVLLTLVTALAPARQRPRRLAARGRPLGGEMPPAAPASSAGAGGGVRAVGPLGRALLADLVAAPPAAPIARARRPGWRRAAYLTLALSVALFAGACVYGWQVATALRDTERSIVVPLPPDAGSIPVAAAPVAPRADTAEAPVAPAATPTPTDPGGGRLGAVGAVFSAATTDEDPGRDPVWRGKRYLNVLVLGFDSREDEPGRPPRSDVFLIAQLDLVAKTVNIVSIPRDLWVTIPGHGEERINAAYALGWRADQPVAGVALTKRTVEQNFGVTLDYYVAVDFQGFQQVVDAVGGVDITVPYYLRDDEYPTEDYGVEKIEFLPGPQHMDGKTALKYVRTRHQDSDYGRRRRQEQLLLALFDRAKGVGIIARLPVVLRSFAGTVQTNFTFEEQLALGRVGLVLDRGNITTYSVDETMTEGWITPGGASVIRGDWRQIDALIARAFVRPWSLPRTAP